MRRTAVRTGVAGIIIVLALGACGSGVKQASSKVSTLQLVAGAADKAADAKSAKVSMSVSAPTGGETIDVTMEGTVDFETNSVEMSMDTGSLGRGAPEGTIKLRIVDGTMYLGMGDLLNGEKGVPAALQGKSWFKLDLPGGASAGGLGGATQQQNPTDFLQSLRGAGKVEEIGKETVNGVPTTHFRTRINLGKAIAGLDPDVAANVKKSMSMFKVADVPVDVWLSEDGLPIRETMGVERSRITMEFSDFGVDVNVVAPPAEDTADFSELMRAASTDAGITN